MLEETRRLLHDIKHELLVLNIQIRRVRGDLLGTQSIVEHFTLLNGRSMTPEPGTMVSHTVRHIGP